MILRELTYDYDCNARHVHAHGRYQLHAHDDGYDRGHDRNKTHPPYVRGYVQESKVKTHYLIPVA